MRTIDRTLWRGTQHPVETKPNHDLDDVLAALARHGSVLEVTNVARLLEGAQLGDLVEEFPCLAPPRYHLWLEWDAGTTRRDRRAVLLYDVFTSGPTSPSEDAPPVAKAAIEAAMNGLRLASPKWVLQAIAYADDRSTVVGPVGTAAVALNDHGGVIGEAWAVQIEDDDVFDDHWLRSTIEVAFKAVALMHCKNVVGVAGEPHPTKVNAKHQKQAGRPLVRLGSLHLQLPRRSGAPRGDQPPTTRDLVGAHIVDGHFAHYGNCCPGTHEPNGLLFGKYEGIYFVGGHLRGSTEAGMVVKPGRTITVE